MIIPPSADANPPPQTPGATPAGRSAEAPARSSVNWMRFWLQMLAAMMVFNIIAGLVTWYFIFPRLHPVH